METEIERHEKNLQRWLGILRIVETGATCGSAEGCVLVYGPPDACLLAVAARDAIPGLVSCATAGCDREVSRVWIDGPGVGGKVQKERVRCKRSMSAIARAIAGTRLFSIDIAVCSKVPTIVDAGLLIAAGCRYVIALGPPDQLDDSTHFFQLAKVRLTLITRADPNA